MTFFYRAEQKPKSKAAKEGAEVFYSYHQSGKDNQSAITAEAIDYFDAKGLNRKEYFKPKIFEIDETEFKNRPDDSEEVSAINGFDYENFNSNQDYITTDDVLFSATALMMFESVREFNNDELQQVESYIKAPSGERVHEYMLSVQMACAFLATCYQEVDVNDDLEIELCNTLIANYPDVENMLQSAVDTLEGREIEIDSDVLSAIEVRFKQIDIEEAERKNTAPDSPIISAIKSHTSFSKVATQRDFILTVHAHIGSLRAMTNLDDVESQIVEHIDTMRDVSCLFVFSDLESEFSNYLEYYDNEKEPGLSGQPASAPSKNEQAENSNDVEIDYPEVWEAIEKRLNQRNEVVDGRVTTKQDEVKHCYSFFAANICDRTNCSALCDKIKNVPHCNVLFNGTTATQMVMQCEPIEQQEEPRTPRKRLAEKFSQETEEAAPSKKFPNDNSKAKFCGISEMYNKHLDDGVVSNAEDESKSLPVEPDTQENRSVSNDVVPDGANSGPANLLDLPDFDDEIENIERQLAESDEWTIAGLNSAIDALAPNQSLIIEDLSNELYHAASGYSKSSLDIINQDPSLLEWSRNCPVDAQKTTIFDFGTAFHTTVLEPHKFDAEVVIEDFGRTSKSGKERVEKFKANNPEKCILTTEEGRQLNLMRGSVFAHPRASILYTHPSGKAEVSIFWRDPATDIVFKIRTDWTCEINGLNFIVDLKSTADADAFEKSVGDFRYHVQDAFYTWVYFNATGRHPVFSFCVTSKSASCGKYKTRLVVLSEYDKEEGRAQFESNIRTLQGCVNTGSWGGFEEIERPAYQRKNDLVKGL